MSPCSSFVSRDWPNQIALFWLHFIRLAFFDLHSKFWGEPNTSRIVMSQVRMRVCKNFAYFCCIYSNNYFYLLLQRSIFPAALLIFVLALLFLLQLLAAVVISFSLHLANYWFPLIWLKWQFWPLHYIMIRRKYNSIKINFP